MNLVTSWAPASKVEQKMIPLSKTSRMRVHLMGLTEQGLEGKRLL